MDDKTQTKVDDFLDGYEDRKESKLDRAERFAENARTRSGEHRAASSALVDQIPMGQPILVGHHSEKGHRKAVERSAKHMDKSVEEGRKAYRWDSRVNAIANDRSIHYDDPEAAEKIEARIAQLEEKQVLYKAINKAHKAFLKKPASLEKASLSDKVKETVRTFKPDAIHSKPFPAYVTSNNSANIRRFKKRLEGLARQREMAVNGRWMLYVKYDGKCSECGTAIAKGQSRAYWVRAERALYCEDCGKKIEAGE